MSNCTSTPKNRVREFLPSNLAEFDTLLSQVLAPKNLRAGYTPAGFWENDESYQIELDLPGVSREGLDITLDKGTLTITAERKHDETDATRKAWREERFYGKLTRAFSLPDTIDSESVTAELSDGVLLVTIAKSPAAQPKKINVK